MMRLAVYYDEIGRISRSFNQLLDIADRLLSEKDYLATHDLLTGIHNRLSFTREIGAEVNRVQRTGAPLSLIILDIDHFKLINDEFGHDAGDEVLKTIARMISGSVRSLDLFCRWGGEEFVLLLRESDFESALSLAEKLRMQIEGHAFAKGKRVTCSFGISTWRNGDTELSFIKRADEALYAAKNSGRNQVRGER